MIARGLDIDHGWMCCALDDMQNGQRFELCKIKATLVTDKHWGYHHMYQIITYYEGKEVFSGNLEECRKWIRDHYVDRRYLDYYGQRN